MKKLICSCLMIIIMLFLVGCSQESVEQESKINDSETITEEIPVVEEPEPSNETAIEEVQVSEETISGYSEKELERLRAKNLYPLEDSDPRAYLSFDDIDLKRISSDRGEVRGLTFTVRNIGDKPIDVEVVALFNEEFLTDGKKGKIEKEFSLPQIPPGFKYTKKYPQTIYFEEIKKSKTVELSIKEKYTTPSTISDVARKNFVPYDEFETLEIKW